MNGTKPTADNRKEFYVAFNLTVWTICLLNCPDLFVLFPSFYESKLRMFYNGHTLRVNSWMIYFKSCDG